MIRTTSRQRCACTSAGCGCECSRVSDTGCSDCVGRVDGPGKSSKTLSHLPEWTSPCLRIVCTLQHVWMYTAVLSAVHALWPWAVLKSCCSVATWTRRGGSSVQIIDVIRKKYTSDPAFTAEVAKKASSAAEGMCKWVHAMDKYEEVAKVVAPKQAALRGAEASYEEVMIGLRALQADLQDLLDKLAAMEADLKSNTGVLVCDKVWTWRVLMTHLRRWNESMERTVIFLLQWDLSLLVSPMPLLRSTVLLCEAC